MMRMFQNHYGDKLHLKLYLRNNETKRNQCEKLFHDYNPRPMIHSYMILTILTIPNFTLEIVLAKRKYIK